MPGEYCPEVRKTSMELKIVLDLKGLKCLGCAANIEKAVSGLRGVKSAHVDLAPSKGIVVLDTGKVSTRDVIAAIRKAGYDASLTE
jgi:copper chaperone CopZ